MGPHLEVVCVTHMFPRFPTFLFCTFQIYLHYIAYHTLHKFRLRRTPREEIGSFFPYPTPVSNPRLSKWSQKHHVPGRYAPTQVWKTGTDFLYQVSIVRDQVLKAI